MTEFMLYTRCGGSVKRCSGKDVLDVNGAGKIVNRLLGIYVMSVWVLGTCSWLSYWYMYLLCLFLFSFILYYIVLIYAC